MRQAQQGLTLIEWLVIAILVVFFAVVGWRVVPLYVDHYYLGSFAQQACREYDVDAMSTKQFKESIGKKVMINNIDYALVDAFTIDRKNGQITLEYERRSPVMFNLDVVASFSTTCSFKEA